MQDTIQAIYTKFSIMNIKQNISISKNGFLFDAETGDSYSVNKTAAEILNLMKEGKNESEIKNAIVSKFEVDELVFERNYYEFTNLLKHMNIMY